MPSDRVQDYAIFAFNGCHFNFCIYNPKHVWVWTLNVLVITTYRPTPLLFFIYIYIKYEAGSFSLLKESIPPRYRKCNRQTTGQIRKVKIALAFWLEPCTRLFWEEGLLHLLSACCINQKIRLHAASKAAWAAFCSMWCGTSVVSMLPALRRKKCS